MKRVSIQLLRTETQTLTHGAPLIDVSITSSLSNKHTFPLKRKLLKSLFICSNGKKNWKEKNRMKFCRWTPCLFFFSFLFVSKVEQIFELLCVIRPKKKRPIGFFLSLCWIFQNNKLSLSAIDLFTVCDDTFQEKTNKKER